MTAGVGEMYSTTGAGAAIAAAGAAQLTACAEYCTAAPSSKPEPRHPEYRLEEVTLVTVMVRACTA